MRNHSRSILLILGVLALTAQDAYAYLDPGSGSVILQAIVAALVGSAVALKVYWQRFKAFFTRLFSKSDPSEAERD